MLFYYNYFLMNEFEKQETKKRDSSQSENQKLSNEMSYGIVCIIDALGTKGAWKQDSPSSYIEKLKDCKKFILNYKQENQSLKDFNNTYLNFHSFSDTFFISYHIGDIEKKLDGRTQDVKDIFLDLEFLMISSLLIDLIIFGIENNMLFRGAISNGFFYTNDSFIIGPAVDDAAFYFDKFDMFGIICTPSTSYRINHLITKYTKDKKANYWADFVEYPIQIKNKYFNDSKIESNSIPERINLYTLDWTKRYYSKNLVLNTEKHSRSWGREKSIPVDPISNLYLDLGKFPFPPSSYIKYKNTIDFYNHCILKPKNEPIKLDLNKWQQLIKNKKCMVE